MGSDSADRKKTAAQQLRSSSGPIDLFGDMRKQWDDSEDPMEIVLSWIAKAWRESDALLKTQVDRVAWGKWKQLNSDKFRDAMELGQSLIFAEMRGVATGQTSHRGQASAQRLVLDVLRNERNGRPIAPVTESPRPAVDLNSKNNSILTGRVHDAMSDFDTEELETIADGDGNAAD